jgi:hypothetical protein
VREVASFMQMYPAYKLRDVLDEYSIIFFTLLNDGYRLQSQNYLMLAQIALMPNNMRDADRSAFLKRLEWATKHPGDILKPTDDNDSGIEDVKQMLRKI